MSMFSRLRNVSPNGKSGEYTKLPTYTPTQSPPFPGMDHDSKTPFLSGLPLFLLPLPRMIQSHCQPPTKRQFLYSTTYAISLALITVIVAQKISPWSPTYYQWLQTRMGDHDPFDEHRVSGGGGGRGEVGRAMWGLHEMTGWDREAMLTEYGFEVLNDGERYHLHHNATEEGTIEYFEDLRQFIIETMPQHLQPKLLTSLYSRLPPSLLPSFPQLIPSLNVSLGPPSMISYKNIFQTDIKSPRLGGKLDRFHQKWRSFNEVDGWEMKFMDDSKGDEWVGKTFAESWGMMSTWKGLYRGVLKADLLRYLLVFIEGGVYSDMDTLPLRPIEHWGANTVEYLDISPTDGLDYLSTLSAHPSVIIGVEIDVDHNNYKWYWPRPVQICQWTLSGAPFHPIYLDVIKHVVNATKVIEESGIDWDLPSEKRRREDLVSILEWTGPPVFSDSVMQYLQSRYRVNWHRLRTLDHPLRIGEILILPKTAFAPETHGAEDRRHMQADVSHLFNGSWKTKQDVF